MTSNQKEIVFSEPVSKRKESGEAKYLVQQYPYLCICKDISIVTILKRGPVDAAGTWDDNVEMEADEERRCQLSVSPRPPAWALRGHLVLVVCALLLISWKQVILIQIRLHIQWIPVRFPLFLHEDKWSFLKQLTSNAGLSILMTFHFFFVVLSSYS